MNVTLDNFPKAADSITALTYMTGSSLRESAGYSAFYVPVIGPGGIDFAQGSIAFRSPASGMVSYSLGGSSVYYGTDSGKQSTVELAGQPSEQSDDVCRIAESVLSAFMSVSHDRMEVWLYGRYPDMDPTVLSLHERVKFLLRSIEYPRAQFNLQTIVASLPLAELSRFSREFYLERTQYFSDPGFDDSTQIAHFAVTSAFDLARVGDRFNERAEGILGTSSQEAGKSNTLRIAEGLLFELSMVSGVTFEILSPFIERCMAAGFEKDELFTDRVKSMLAKNQSSRSIGRRAYN